MKNQSISVNETPFIVNLNSIHLNRKVGVSGMMRVRNDAEFIEACITSCIDALDELIIVYNDCTDCSPDIIKKIACQYPQKIKVYEYTPWLYCGNLTKEDYDKAKDLPESSVHLLSNYYNFALSKTTCQFVVKIDADQIYFTERLNEICSLYRSRRLKIPTPSEIFSFIKVNLHFRTNLSFSIKKRTVDQYHNCIKKLISTLGITTSYSGINLVFDSNGNLMVPLGLETNNLNILMPFNGVGDHLIFKVNRRTHFIPFDCKEYSTMISGNYSYIEKLVGQSRSYLNGFLWWHLNGIRRNILEKQHNNIRNYPDSFLDLNKLYYQSVWNLKSSIKSLLYSDRYLKNMIINQMVNWFSQSNITKVAKTIKDYRIHN